MHLLLPLLLACTPDPVKKAPADTAVDLGTCDAETGGRQLWVVNSLTFARVADGVSDGFDLDGQTSEIGGSTGCGKGDFTAPSGAVGVDNAFGSLLPALEATEFSAAEPLIDSLIHSGELMILAEVAGMDDRVDDACVGIALRRAVGEPLVGTDGEMLWGQTLELDTRFDDVEIDAAAIEDGSVSGAPVAFVLPMAIIDAQIEFPITNGAVRMDLHEDGSISGIVAGGLNVEAVLEEALDTGIAADLKALLSTALYAAADLDPDETGACQAVSVSLAYTAVPVYVFDE
jgi:hypothetical protein